MGDHAGTSAKKYNDTSWKPVGLPHSFSMPYFLSSELYSGYGWYRKEFKMPPMGKNNKVSLDFEGVFQVAENR